MRTATPHSTPSSTRRATRRIPDERRPAADAIVLIERCLDLTDDAFAVLDGKGAILVANMAFKRHISGQGSPVFEMPNDLTRIDVGARTILHFKSRRPRPERAR